MKSLSIYGGFLPFALSNGSSRRYKCRYAISVLYTFSTIVSPSSLLLSSTISTEIRGIKIQLKLPGLFSKATSSFNEMKTLQPIYFLPLVFPFFFLLFRDTPCTRIRTRGNCSLTNKRTERTRRRSRNYTPGTNDASFDRHLPLSFFHLFRTFSLANVLTTTI